MADKRPLWTEINRVLKEWFQKMGLKSDLIFFNYELNCSTWRMLVNKQICMQYERMRIDYQ